MWRNYALISVVIFSLFLSACSFVEQSATPFWKKDAPKNKIGVIVNEFSTKDLQSLHDVTTVTLDADAPSFLIGIHADGVDIEVWRVIYVSDLFVEDQLLLQKKNASMNETFQIHSYRSEAIPVYKVKLTYKDTFVDYYVIDNGKDMLPKYEYIGTKQK